MEVSELQANRAERILSTLKFHMLYRMKEYFEVFRSPEILRDRLPMQKQAQHSSLQEDTREPITLMSEGCRGEE